MSNNTMYDIHRLFFINRDIAVNQNGEFYQRGQSYSMEIKLRVAATYLDAKEKSIDAGFGPRPVISRVASECGVGWHFVEKVKGGLLTEDHIISVVTAQGLPIRRSSSCLRNTFTLQKL